MVDGLTTYTHPLDFCPILCHHTGMKNTHLQHPEDSILSGDLSVLDWFLAESDLSVKIDGAPAIVWGTNPATGNFFVGTKSVFNKKVIKINETHDDIDQNHSGVVADILHHCFDCLPSFDGIVQGDFIGYGGDDTFCPNTITYIFDEIIEENIVIAPHTFYATDGELKDAYVINDAVNFDDTESCKFVQPSAWQLDEDFDEIVGFARQMSQLVTFAEPLEAEKIKIDLNRCIREGCEVDPETFDNSHLISYWLLIKSIKEDMLYICRNNGPEAYIDDRQCGGEGYVRTNDYGMFKLVDREQFSHANFNNDKFSCAS
tara:strand:+ start:1854 stop:2801 length:948 start_codon:yes stop_codon:yes gene_type:complete